MFVALNIAVPDESLLNATDPVAQLLALFEVEALNAAREYCIIDTETPAAVRRATSPATRAMLARDGRRGLPPSPTGEEIARGLVGIVVPFGMSTGPSAVMA
jgi:hypothetical protein